MAKRLPMKNEASVAATPKMLKRNSGSTSKMKNKDNAMIEVITLSVLKLTMFNPNCLTSSA
ncbi:hypothetical protein HR45_01280 [Shewanella mangrovi]|uniref:Uncharacterized protein n=1 Tax=Shewanella mangrovi TaxID=1515746 RepID=A0A094JLX7_9GAMM|nr:hypothetical protein [Shewanella mangrovi]KFZ39059.1 hypothetical protein HR45_01280 [Shewanella mangrovi]